MRSIYDQKVADRIVQLIRIFVCLERKIIRRYFDASNKENIHQQKRCIIYHVFLTLEDFMRQKAYMFKS